MLVPPSNLTPEQFELLVLRYLRRSKPRPSGLRLEHREVLPAPDGEYEIDITARFEALGGSFLVLCECKFHRASIKRELVEVLHSKVLSTGANKGFLFSSSLFQKGAVRYAQAHGLSLRLVQRPSVTAIVKGATPPTRPGHLYLSRFALLAPTTLLPEPSDEDVWQVSYAEAQPPSLAELLSERSSAGA